MQRYENHELNFVPKCKRWSTRFTEDHIFFPDIAYETQKKIESHFGISKEYRTVFSKGQGIYSGLSEPYCGYYEYHTDPVYEKDTITLHCNIVVTENVGGEVEIHDEIIEMKKGMVIMYPVSLVPHRVLAVRNNTFRNLWVFGYSIPEKEYSSLW